MIIDCFPFFDELDLLEIRVNELKEIVDVFLLTESDKTFSGIKKPLYFKENKDRFKGFNIIDTVYTDNVECAPMEREVKQKQYNLDYAFENIFSPGDIILQGDCDEIPRASVLEKAVRDNGWESAGLRMQLCYYWMNCCLLKRPRNQRDTRVLRPKNRIKYNVRQNDRDDVIIDNGGWHFSFMGDIKNKIEAWGHSDRYNRPPFNTDKHIEKCKKNGLDLFKRKGLKFNFVSDLSFLPVYVIENIEKFRGYIKWS